MSKGPSEAEGQMQSFPTLVSLPSSPASPCFPRAGACDERSLSVTSVGAETTGLPRGREFRCGGVSGTLLPVPHRAAAISMEDLDLATRDPSRELHGLGLVFSFFTAEKAGRVAVDNG